MTRSVPIGFRGNELWAYDVLATVLLQHAVDIARPQVNRHPWLADQIRSWEEIIHVGGNLFLGFDDDWGQREIEIVVSIFESASDSIARRKSIPATEIERWFGDNCEENPCRGEAEVATAPVVRLAKGVIALLRGSHPKPPSGTAWYYSVEDEVLTPPWGRS